jgi:hypothetical protein
MIEIPFWLALMSIPWCLTGLYSLKFSSHQTGGGSFCPPTSARGDFLRFMVFVNAPLSLLIGFVYWMGKAKRWW